MQKRKKEIVTDNILVSGLFFIFTIAGIRFPLLSSHTFLYPKYCITRKVFSQVFLTKTCKNFVLFCTLNICILQKINYTIYCPCIRAIRESPLLCKWLSPLNPSTSLRMTPLFSSSRTNVRNLTAYAVPYNSIANLALRIAH